MKQVFLKDGRVVVEDVPAPSRGENEVLVKVVRSCISTVTELGGLITGAVHSEPDSQSSAWTSWYSAAGVVLETGEGIHDIFPGDRVACAGARNVRHAGVISIPRNLLVPVPDEVSFDEAASVVPGTIAMQGVRSARPALGENFVVIGLGLLGQLTVQILKANGCRVIGVDPDDRHIRMAGDLGIDYCFNPADKSSRESAKRITGRTGVDGVIITSSGSEEIIAAAFQMCRKKGRVVLVGDVVIDINSADVYRKELDFFISTSCGPGRYDREYEEKEVEYPLGYVRWTENRNMEEYIYLIREGKISVTPLIEEIFPVDNAADACNIFKDAPEKPFMVLLRYPGLKRGEQPAQKIENPAVKSVETKKVRIAVVGAGKFARAVHLPNLIQHTDLYSLEAVADRNTGDADNVAKVFGARYSTTDFGQIIDDKDIDAVFIITRHNLHAKLTVEALKAGKHVFVERPLAVNKKELGTIKNFFTSSGNGDVPLLLTGFNSRFSPFAQRIRKATEERGNPMILNYRMNAGYIPLTHWVHTEEGGGRNIGEACHIYDLFTYLSDAVVRTVEARAIKPSTELCSRSDNFVTTITFADGSVANLTYTALDSNHYPKERFEVYCDNMVLALDNYNELAGYGIHDVNFTSVKEDKGYVREIREFAKAILGQGSWPIPLWQQYQAMEIAFSVERLLASKQT